MATRIIWHPEVFNAKLKKDVNKRTEKSAREYMQFVKANAPVKSGRLKNSIKVMKNKLMQYRIFSDVPYALFVEYGTSRMSPKPYWRPTLNSFKSRIKRIFS